MAAINGDGNPNTLNDTGENDSIDAQGNADTITVSQGGTDTVDGGEGSDRLILDARLLGGTVSMGAPAQSADGLTGSASWAATSIQFQRIEHFTIFTHNSSTYDFVITGGGDDVFHHSPQNSLAYLHDGIALGAGTDTLVADFTGITAGSVALNVASLNANGYSGLVTVGGNGKVEYSGVDRFMVTGSELGDSLIAGRADDVLKGGGGDDILTGAGGNDAITGGIGNDTLNGDSTHSYSQTSDNLGHNGSATPDGDVGVAGEYYASNPVEFNIVTQPVGAVGSATLTIDATDVESAAGFPDEAVEVLLNGNLLGRLTVGSNNQRLTTVFNVDPAFLVEGANAVVVRNVNTSSTWSMTIHGGALTLHTAGADTIDGEAGNDAINAGAGNDVITGGAGNDTIDAGSGDDVVNVSLDYDVVDGGAGDDRLVIDYSTEAAAVSNYGTTLPGYQGYISNPTTRGVQFKGIEHFTITTGSGNDNLKLGTGNDIVSLGQNNDRLDAGTGTLDADGGDGIDGISVDLSATSIAVTFDLRLGGEGGYAGPAGIRIVNFEYLLDFKTGSGNDTISTSAAALNDKIHSGGGDDSILVISGYDQVFGGDGNDRLTIDYSTETASVRNHTPGAGFDGYISNPTLRGVQYNGIESFDIRTGSGDDVLKGSSGADVIDSGAGDDTIDGGEGADDLQGGAGTDTLRGEGGNDTLRYSGLGNDPVHGGDGDDTLIVDFSGATRRVVNNGNAAQFGFEASYWDEFMNSVAFTSVERIVITTGAFDDILTTYGGNDEIHTGAGGDTVSAGGGNDVVNGDGGDDTLDGGDGDDVIDGGADSDTVSYAKAATGVTVSLAIASPQNTGFGQDTLSNVENLNGSAHGDTLTGNGQANRLAGLGGDDTLDGNGGADTLTGGAGNDVYIVDSSDDLVIEDQGEGNADEVRTSIANYVLPENVERLVYTGTETATLRGNGLDNTMSGSDGRNIFLLQDGGDDGAAGRDGIDSFYFGGAFTSSDYVDGGSNRDAVILQGDYGAGVTLGSGTTSNIADVEAISLLSGANTSFGEPGTNRYDYRLTMLDSNVAAGALMKVNGFHLLAGEDFTFNGSAETDSGYQVFAGLGRDELTGGAMGDNFIFGHDGRFAAGDTVIGGGGYDVVYLRGDYSIDFNAAGFAGSLSGVESIGLLSATSNEFVGGGGTEFDYNLTWNDAMLATGVNFTVNGSRLVASETMVFDGSLETGGNFRIFGGASADTLTGGAGADLLLGGGGADRLTGGAGADVFRFQSIDDSRSGNQPKDFIADFDASDLIDLARMDANKLAEGDQAFSFIGSDAYSKTAGELRVINVSSNVWVVEGDVDGDGAADFQFTLNTTENQPLAASDFML